MEALSIQWSASKHQVLENQVTGFWANNTWSIDEYPLYHEIAAKYRSKNVYFECIYSSINTEIKYACWQKLKNQEWSISTFWTQGTRIKKIAQWLNYVIKNENSLIDKNLEYWVLSLRSYLVDKQQLREYTSERLGKDQGLKVILVQDPTIILFRQIYKVIVDFYDDREEYEKNVWDFRKLGIKVDKTKSDYRITFDKITQPWLLEATKKFIRYTLSILSTGECANRVSTLRDFSAFIAHYHPSLKPEDIDRPIILEYITQLPATGLAAGTRHRQIGCLRTFLELCAREGWANVPDKRLIHNEDFPRISRGLPRYIPEEVMSQLNQHIEDLPLHIMRMTLVLQECGMRIGELCQLPFNCLSQDVQGDWFLRYYQSKMKNEHIVPISKECAAVIQEQQNVIKEEWDVDFPYLFPTPKSYGKGNPMKQKPFTDALNKLACDKNIRDINGKLWRFQAHQFRHTVGTRMVNNGVPHHIIQRYLGHQSPEMTARYAYIHDQTLKEEFAKFKGKVVDVMGRVVESEDTQSNSSDLQWVKKNILTQALPNGTCALPVIAGSCPHANACLTCTHFRTTTDFLDEHKKQLDQTKQIIETAQGNGWQRQVEMNEKVQENLERIIASLEVKEDEA